MSWFSTYFTSSLVADATDFYDFSLLNRFFSIIDLIILAITNVHFNRKNEQYEIINKSFKNPAPSSALRSVPSCTPPHQFHSPRISWNLADISEKHSYFTTHLLRELKGAHIADKLEMFSDILRGEETITRIAYLFSLMLTLLNILFSCMRTILFVKSSMTSLSLSRIADYLHNESITSVRLWPPCRGWGRSWPRVLALN